MRDKVLIIMISIMLCVSVTSCSVDPGSLATSSNNAAEETEGGFFSRLKEKHEERKAEKEAENLVIDVDTIDFDLIREQLDDKVSNDDIYKDIVGYTFEITEPAKDSESDKPVLHINITVKDHYAGYTEMYIMAGKMFMYINDLAHEQNPDLLLSSEDSFGTLYNSIDGSAHVSDNVFRTYRTYIDTYISEPHDEELLKEMNR